MKQLKERDWVNEKDEKKTKPLYFQWKLYKLFNTYANEHEEIMHFFFSLLSAIETLIISL